MGKTIFTRFKRLLHISAVIKQIPPVLQFHIFCTNGYIFFPDVCFTENYIIHTLCFCVMIIMKKDVLVYSCIFSIHSVCGCALLQVGRRKQSILDGCSDV